MDQPAQPSSEDEKRRTSDARREDPYEGATPPGYDDWPTHGGYLGCLLGVMTSCLLAPVAYALYFVFYGFTAVYARGLGGFGHALAVIVTVALYLAVFVAISRLGWRLGKRFLREYEQPSRPVWGEDDDEPEERVVDAEPTAEASDTVGATEPAPRVEETR